MGMSGRCPNCEAELTGAYCASCGKKNPRDDLTLREFLGEGTHELTHWDGKVPRTLTTVLLKPGLLSLDYLAGRRARWLPPLRVYLICSVAYFVSVPTLETVTHRSAREVAKVTLTNPGGAAVLLYILWYAPVALRRVFGGGWGVTIAKVAGVGTIYLVCYLVASFGLMLYSLSTM
jgi:hypothetical protein